MPGLLGGCEGGGEVVEGRVLDDLLGVGRHGLSDEEDVPFPDRVREDTRVRVDLAVADLGFVRGGTMLEHAAHWRRNGFATWLFTPAVSGWYPKKAPQEARSVPILGEPWPGIPARGRGAAARADACRLPIAKGLTPHGLRHTHQTLMEDLGTEKVLRSARFAVVH